MKNSTNQLKLKNINLISNKLSKFIKSYTIDTLGKKGVVIGLSGGLDSSVTAALATKSLGSENVFGLIMPEKESSPQSQKLAKLLVNQLKIKSEVVDITKILDSYDIYNIREKIVKKYFSKFNKNCKYRLSVPKFDPKKSKLRIPFLEIQDNKNNIHQFNLNSQDFSTLYSATSIKHRTRMAMLYFYAEKNNLSVVGSTNKSEYIQGYFVKYGDGGVDLEPIQNLYKTQVYDLGRHLKIPSKILSRKASPDTWSFETTDEDFFFGISYENLDIILHERENGIEPKKIEKITGLKTTEIKTITKYLDKRKKSTSHMRKSPSSIKS